MPKQDEELEFLDAAEMGDEGEMNSAGGAGFGGGAGGGAGGEAGGYDKMIGNWVLNQSKHPLTVVFHVLFKAAALFIYMFGSWFTSSFIFTFVICIILLAFDFWTVKNVSGRLLVGLRWWSYVREDGSNEWFFESLEDMAEISQFDSRIFWGALYATPAAWSLMLVIGVLRLKFEYLPIVFTALGLSSFNIYNYLKCSSSATSKMKNMVAAGMKVGGSSALENSSVRNWVFSTLLGAVSAPPSGSSGGSARASHDTL